MRTTIIYGMITLLISWGCSKDDGGDESTTPPEGSIEELRNYYTPEFVDAMVALDFDFNLGSAPPDIEGSFLISPFILQKSTVPKDSNSIGNQYNNYTVTFSNQNNKNLTIDLSGVQGNQTDVGNGSFITGNNNTFAVYTKTTTTNSDGTYPRETALAISGTLTDDGIENIQFFGAMLDDNGDPKNALIENNTGRFFTDGDGFSEKEGLASKQVTGK